MNKGIPASHLGEHAEMAADVGLGHQCIVQGRVRGHRLILAWAMLSSVFLFLVPVLPEAAAGPLWRA